jgi:hypothetical protein
MEGKLLDGMKLIDSKGHKCTGWKELPIIFEAKFRNVSLVSTYKKKKKLLKKSRRKLVVL